MQRSRGRAEVAFRAGMQLDRLHQEGSAKAILPKVDGAAPEVVFLNTSGGLTGGDRLDYALAVPEGGRAVATTQTAERAYRACAGEARVRVRLSVGAGGWLDWLPQETILFDGCRLDREVEVDLGDGAGCLFLETVILGRHAMGEVVAGLSLRDRRTIRSGGRPVWMEPLALDTAALARGGHPAVFGGARAFATLTLVRPDAADLLPLIRRVLDQPEVEAASSTMDGKCVVRFLAGDGLALRRQVIRAIRAVRPGALPRVWQV
jgi:urease accessory protein